MFKTTKLALMVAATSMVASSAFAQEVTLRFQHFVSPKSAVPAYFMAPWAEKIGKDSGGRIKVELYPGMQLGGKPPALFDQIKDGVIDGGWALPAYTPGRFPETEALELPFMGGNSAEATSQAAWDFVAKYPPKEFGAVKLIAVHVHGRGVVHKKGGPIKSIDDFKGLKLRGPSRQANKLLEKMGATPVGMPVPAFPEALSKGVVDGGVIPWEIVIPLKVHELADSHTEVGGDRSLYNTFFIWAMNQNSYDKLPDDLKKIIDDNSGLAASAWAGRAMDQGDGIALKTVNEKGNDIYEMSADQRAPIEELAKTLTSEWAAEMDGKGLSGDAMVSDAQAFVAKYAK